MSIVKSLLVALLMGVILVGCELPTSNGGGGGSSSDDVPDGYTAIDRKDDISKQLKTSLLEKKDVYGNPSFVINMPSDVIQAKYSFTVGGESFPTIATGTTLGSSISPSTTDMTAEFLVIEEWVTGKNKTLDSDAVYGVYKIQANVDRYNKMLPVPKADGTGNMAFLRYETGKNLDSTPWIRFQIPTGGTMAWVYSNDMAAGSFPSASNTGNAGNNLKISLTSAYSYILGVYWPMGRLTSDYTEGVAEYFVVPITANQSTSKPFIQIGSSSYQSTDASPSAAQGTHVIVTAPTEGTYVYVLTQTGNYSTSPSVSQFVQNGIKTYDVTVDFAGSNQMTIWSYCKEQGKQAGAIVQFVIKSQAANSKQLYVILSQSNGQVTMKAAESTAGTPEVSGASIRYTINGDTPTSSSLLYGGSAMTISSGTVVKAKAFSPAAGGYLDSSVSELTVTGGVQPTSSKYDILLDKSFDGTDVVVWTSTEGASTVKAVSDGTYAVLSFAVTITNGVSLRNASTGKGLIGNGDSADWIEGVSGTPSGSYKAWYCDSNNTVDKTKSYLVVSFRAH